MSVAFAVFFVIGTIAVASSILVILMRNPVHSALFLLLTLLCVAILFVMKAAEFVAAVQVLVYAGGIMVLFLFVIMLVHQRTVLTATAFHHQWDIALLLIGGALVVFLYILGTETFPSVTSNPDALKSVAGRVVGNTEAVALYLYRDYLLPFEVASVFLLVAMIGAVVLGRRSTEKMD